MNKHIWIVATVVDIAVIECNNHQELLRRYIVKMIGNFEVNEFMKRFIGNINGLNSFDFK